MDDGTRHDTALKIYFDATATIRHHDGERMATHRIAVAVVGALLAFTSSGAFVEDAMIVPLSVFGALLCLTFHAISKKYESLVWRERAKARAARNLLQTLGDDVIVSVDLTKQGDAKASLFGKISLQSLWSLFYILISMSFMYIGIRSVLF